MTGDVMTAPTGRKLADQPSARWFLISSVVFFAITALVGVLVSLKFGSSGIRVGFAGTGFLPRMQPTAQRLEGKRGPCVAGDRGRLDVGSGACVTETSMPAS